MARISAYKPLCRQSIGYWHAMPASYLLLPCIVFFLASSKPLISKAYYSLAYYKNYKLTNIGTIGMLISLMFS
nr:MAG TPA: hypothetical protein [Caudoviricetes sp.]